MLQIGSCQNNHLIIKSNFQIKVNIELKLDIIPYICPCFTEVN